MPAWYWQPPRPHPRALTVWRRNLLVWRRLIGPSLVINFGEPLLYLVGLGYGLGLFVGRMAGLDYLGFLAGGILAASAMHTASFEGLFSVYTRMVPQRTYEAMLATPLTADDIVAGEMLWCATKAVINAAAILLVAALLGAVHSPLALWSVPLLALIGLCFAGPAMVMSAWSPGYDFFNYYLTLVITPMFILCGVFYPIDSLPVPVQQAVAWLPLTHGVALVRPLLAGHLAPQWPLHLAVLLGYTAAGYYLATALVRRRLLV